MHRLLILGFALGACAGCADGTRGMGGADAGEADAPRAAGDGQASPGASSRAGRGRLSDAAEHGQDDIGEVLGRGDGGSASEPSWTVFTFNVGTSKGLAHDVDGDEYDSEAAEITDQFYHNSLSWQRAEDALAVFVAAERPAIAFLQEVFYDGWCAQGPQPPPDWSVCAHLPPDGALQLERVFGPDYQIACHEGHPDKCIAVRRDIGRIRGCPKDGVCLDGLHGGPPPWPCSHGPRAARAEVDLADGTTLVVVSIHATSGLSAEDAACRAAQFRRVFIDAGDGSPLAPGSEPVLIGGDLNTDPLMFAASDESAATWNEHVGAGKAFVDLAEPDQDAPASYLGIAHLDHIATNAFEGDCVVAGRSAGVPPVLEATYWDHSPVVCKLRWHPNWR